MVNTKQKALAFLKENVTIKEVYATADGFLFLKKADALNHAKVLNADAPSVQTFTASDKEEKAIKEEDLTDKEPKPKKKGNISSNKESKTDA